MLYFSLLCISLVSQNDSGRREYTAKEFSEVVQLHNATIEEISFVFEGGMELINEEQLPQDANLSKVKALEEMFQGFYARKNDNSAVIEIYKSNKNMPVNHIKLAMNHGKILKQSYIENRPVFDLSKKSAQTGLKYSFLLPSSPEHMLYNWLFTKDFEADERGYEFLGWESINGHACIKVNIDETTTAERRGQSIPKDEKKIFYLDADRDFRPIKIESYEGGKLHHVNNIELKQVIDSKNKKIWIPVRSIVDSFRWNHITYNKPVFRKTTDILIKTLSLNNTLPQSMFSLDDHIARRNIESSVKERLGQPKAVNLNTMKRFDHQEIAKNLDEKISKIRNDTKKPISLPDVETSGLSAGQCFLMMLGVLTVISGCFVLWKNKS